MNTPNVHAGRLERRVRRVGNETMFGVHGFCSFFTLGAIREVPLLRLTALLDQLGLYLLCQSRQVTLRWNA